MGIFSFVKAGKKIFGKVKSSGTAIKSVKPNVPKTRLEKASRDLKIAKQKTKGAGAKLKQTTFEIKQGNYGKLTFDPLKANVTKKSKLKDKKMDKKIEKEFGVKFRVGKMGGGMMSRRFGMNKGGKIPTTPKEKKFAALAPPRDRITYSDKIAGATGRQKAAIGGMIVKLGKAGKKFLKSKEGKEKLKEIDSKKGKEFTEKMLKKLKDAGFKGGGPAMSKLPAKEEKKQKAQKRMTAANKFLKNRKRSFGSIMREKHMR